MGKQGKQAEAEQETLVRCGALCQTQTLITRDAGIKSGGGKAG
ncbi:hypothetical protein PsSCT_21670 [Pseudomonas sp. SCT]